VVRRVCRPPPTTLTQTDSVDSLGWRPSVVWGFDPDDDALVDALARRFEVAEMPVGTHVDCKDLVRIARASGGLPRHAIDITHRAAELARRGGGERVAKTHVDQGIAWKAETLGRGLNAGDLTLLTSVNDKGLLPPDPGAAALFANGRIIAAPPAPGRPIQRFIVHPLLRAEVVTMGGEE